MDTQSIPQKIKTALIRATVIDYLVWSTIGLILIAEFLMMFENFISPYPGLSVGIAATVTGMTAMLYSYRSIISKLWEHPVGKGLVGLVGFVFTTFAWSYADMAIFDITGHASTLFPRAAAILTVYFSIPVWILVLFWIAGGVFFIQIALVVWTWLQLGDWFYESAPYRYMREIIDVKWNRSTVDDLIREGVYLVSLVLLLAVLPKFHGVIMEKGFVKSFTREVIVSTSFMENGGRCPNPKVGPKEAVMPIKETTVVVLKDNFPYPVVECDPNIQSASTIKK